MYQLNQPVNLLPRDGVVHLYEDFLAPDMATQLMQCLTHEINWVQREIVLFGKAVMQPRLMAWCGDRMYQYSGISLAPAEWHPTLFNLKQRIETCSGHQFNTALLNLYRDGQDSMGWHQDNEKVLGDEPVIASLSLGAQRRFKFKHKFSKSMPVDVNLSHGSLLIMAGQTQHQWLHSLPKSKIIKQPRINITLRNVMY